MAKALVILALFVMASLATSLVAHGFVLRPTTVTAIGTAKKGQYLWKPQRGVSLTPSIGAVRMSLSADDCDDRKGECKYGIAYTTDAGETFHVNDGPEFNTFCGLGGLKQTVSGEDEKVVTLTCPTAELIAGADEASPLSYKAKVFTFTQGEKTVTVADAAEPFVFNQPAEATGIGAATALYMGDTLASFDAPKDAAKTGAADLIFARNVEMTLANGTTIHGFYKSVDGGFTFDYVSALPFPMGTESAMHVTGATKVMIIAGESNNYKQAVSVFIGSRWEKIENVTYSSPLSTFSSDLGTTVYGGLRGRPGLIGMAAGKKRGTEKLIDFANLHNKAITRMIKDEQTDLFNGINVGNYSADFINATEFECVAGGANEDAMGCASSSYAAVIPVGNASTILAFYDKLNNGYNPSTGLDGEQTLFVMKLALNETKEQKELDDKIKEEALAEEKRKVAEEKRKQAQRESEQREREKKRKKNRANKAKVRKFRKMDKAVVADAKAFMAANKEDDVVLIRDVLPDFIEQERDTFFDAFGPNAEAIAAAEEKEELEAEEKRKAAEAKKAAKKKAAEAEADAEAPSSTADDEKKDE